jgi:hypothetical protein
VQVPEFKPQYHKKEEEGGGGGREEKERDRSHMSTASS